VLPGVIPQCPEDRDVTTSRLGTNVSFTRGSGSVDAGSLVLARSSNGIPVQMLRWSTNTSSLQVSCVHNHTDTRYDGSLARIAP